MKTGLELIQQERNEQVDKHGFSLEAFDQYCTDQQLVQAAKMCLEMVGRGPGFEAVYNRWPEGWGKYFKDKIRFKTDIGKLVVAGAFYMAENERLGREAYPDDIRRIAAEIDKLLTPQP